MFIQLLPLKVQSRCDLPKCFPAEILNRSQTMVGTRGWCILSSKIWANSTAQYPGKSLGNLKKMKKKKKCQYQVALINSQIAVAYLHF